ncbi:MAG: transcriptional regulator, partial [Erythrobacteraceae bacterium]|nr:transcriptional regulator [Erythrobacteraceae bacterium]
RRESRSIIYSADYAAMNGLMGYLTENCCGGMSCSQDTECFPSPQRKSA